MKGGYAIELAERLKLLTKLLHATTDNVPLLSRTRRVSEERRALNVEMNVFILCDVTFDKTETNALIFTFEFAVFVSHNEKTFKLNNARRIHVIIKPTKDSFWNI